MLHPIGACTVVIEHGKTAQERIGIASPISTRFGASGGGHTMDGQVRVKVLVGPRVVFEADEVDLLVAELEQESDFWSSILPDGVRSRHSDVHLKADYPSVLALIRRQAFKRGRFDLAGRKSGAIYPVHSTAEGGALAHYAETELSFAIVRFLWEEARWLDQDVLNDPSDQVAKDIGAMLVTAVRLGTTFLRHPGTR